MKGRFEAGDFRYETSFIQGPSMLRKFVIPGAATALLAALAPPAHAAWSGLNMTSGVTTLSGKIKDIHMLMLWVCVVIAIFVFGWMIYSLVKFRKSQGAVPDTTLLHSTKAEIIWTVIPVLILVATAVPAARTLIEIEDARGTQLTIKITGYQWKWQYDYLDSGVSFFSTLSRDSNAARQLDSGIDPNTIPNYLLSVDNPLVVPVGKKIRLLLTAQDVIHSWWVPALAMKKDAIPGVVNETWFEIEPDKPGIYRGQCAELCGRDHGFMPIVVEAKTPEDFAAWLASKKQPAADASRRGGHPPQPRPPPVDRYHPSIHRTSDAYVPGNARRSRRAPPRRKGEGVHPPLGDDHQPQGHRHDVPGVLAAPCSSSAACSRWASAWSCSSRACSSSIRHSSTS